MTTSKEQLEKAHNKVKGKLAGPGIREDMSREIFLTVILTPENFGKV